MYVMGAFCSDFRGPVTRVLVFQSPCRFGMSYPSCLFDSAGPPLQPARIYFRLETSSFFAQVWALLPTAGSATPRLRGRRFVRRRARLLSTLCRRTATTSVRADAMRLPNTHERTWTSVVALALTPADPPTPRLHRRSGDHPSGDHHRRRLFPVCQHGGARPPAKPRRFCARPVSPASSPESHRVSRRPSHHPSAQPVAIGVAWGTGKYQSLKFDTRAPLNCTDPVFPNRVRWKPEPHPATPAAPGCTTRARRGVLRAPPPLIGHDPAHPLLPPPTCVQPSPPSPPPLPPKSNASPSTARGNALFASALLVALGRCGCVLEQETKWL